jgi:hypothetical protein
MRAMLEAHADQFDVVIMDTPPLLGERGRGHSGPFRRRGHADNSRGPDRPGICRASLRATGRDQGSSRAYRSYAPRRLQMQVAELRDKE